MSVSTNARAHSGSASMSRYSSADVAPGAALRQDAHADAGGDHSAHGLVAAHEHAHGQLAVQRAGALQDVGLQSALAKAHMRQRNRLLEAHHLPVTQPMPVGHHQHQPVGRKQPALEIGRLERCGHGKHADVRRTVGHAPQDFARGPLLDVHRHAGTILHEHREGGRQGLGDGRCVREDAEMPDAVTGKRDEIVSHVLDLAQDRASMPQQCFARMRQH
jgi:hypothetical protein